MRDRRKQFNNFILEDIISKFKETANRKYGFYAKNMWSYEVEQLLKFYHSVGGILPDATHAHKNSTENNKVRFNHSKRVKEPQIIPQVNDTTITGFKGFRNIPQTSPLLQWVKKNGGFNFEERHYELAERLRSDPEYREQWHKETMAKLRAKARRIDNYQMQLKLKGRDKEIRPEIREIKQYLVTTDNISNVDKISREKLHNALRVITGRNDPRTFDKHIREYVQHEYFTPINREETFFSAGTKYLEI